MSQKIREALHRLSISETDRLLSARLWEVIADIDAAIAAGVKAATIKKMLQDQGIDLPPHSLRGVLYRYRKKRKTTPETSPTRSPIPTKTEGVDRTKSASPPVQSGTYRSDLSPEEKALLEAMDPSEKIEFFRKKYNQNKFTHNPTPERFRKDGK